MDSNDYHTPLLQALKEYKVHFHEDHFISLPNNTPFGNLNLSWAEIAIRIECVNETITNLYTDFYKDKFEKRGWLTLDEGYKSNFYTEQIIYWLRKTTDEIISLISLLNYFKRNKKYPKKIKCSSIGEFISQKPTDCSILNKFQKLLETLNEISNGYKHSIVNSQIHNLKGRDYPVVFAYVLNHNNRSNEAKFYTLSFTDLLVEYNDFLTEIQDYLISNFALSK